MHARCVQWTTKPLSDSSSSKACSATRSGSGFDVSLFLLAADRSLAECAEDGVHSGLVAGARDVGAVTGVGRSWGVCQECVDFVYGPREKRRTPI